MKRLRLHVLGGTLAAMLCPGAPAVRPLRAQAITPVETPDIGRRQVVPFLEGTKVFVNVPRASIVRLGGRYRREWLRTINAGQPDEEHLGSTHWTVGAFADLHFNTARRLEPFYGTRRFHGYFGIGRQLSKVCKSRAAASATVFYVGQEPNGVPPLAYQVDGLCTFTPRGGWGVFARYYGGQDYYNLAFGQRIQRLQVGIQYDQDGFLRFITAQAKRSLEQRRQKAEQRP